MKEKSFSYVWARVYEEISLPEQSPITPWHKGEGKILLNIQFTSCRKFYLKEQHIQSNPSDPICLKTGP